MDVDLAHAITEIAPILGCAARGRPARFDRPVSNGARVFNLYLSSWVVSGQDGRGPARVVRKGLRALPLERGALISTSGESKWRSRRRIRRNCSGHNRSWPLSA